MLAISTRHLYPKASNLHWLNSLRLIAICGQIISIGFVHWGLNIVLPLLELGLTILCMVIIAALTWWRLRAVPRSVTDIEILMHLVMDITALTILLYLTGGGTNPFVSLYLLPISIATIILPTPLIWALTAMSMVAYSALIFLHQPLFVESHTMQGFGLHVLGMWITFVISALLIVYFVTHMMKAIRERDQRLLLTREKNLRDEQIIGIATLAASAAHELATPLSTVALIAQDLHTELSEAGRVELDIILSQIARCKTILQELRNAASVSEHTENQAISDILSDLKERWQVLFPLTSLTIQIKASVKQLALTWDQTLSFALLNLLANAAEASPQEIALEIDIDGESLVIDVLDRGSGLDDTLLGQVGDFMVTTKSDPGHGLGLFLTNATIERFGGTVHLLERKGGGLIARALLPLPQLQNNPRYKQSYER